MDFELLAWGDGINADFSDRVVVTQWVNEPSQHMVHDTIDMYLLGQDFEQVEDVFCGTPYYDVLKDGVWKRVYFKLEEN